MVCVLTSALIIACINLSEPTSWILTAYKEATEKTADAAFDEFG